MVARCDGQAPVLRQAHEEVLLALRSQGGRRGSPAEWQARRLEALRKAAEAFARRAREKEEERGGTRLPPARRAQAPPPPRRRPASTAAAQARAPASPPPLVRQPRTARSSAASPAPPPPPLRETTAHAPASTPTSPLVRQPRTARSSAASPAPPPPPPLREPTAHAPASTPASPLVRQPRTARSPAASPAPPPPPPHREPTAHAPASTPTWEHQPAAAWERARSLARRRRQRAAPHHCAVLFEDDYSQWDVPTGHDTSAGAAWVDQRIASANAAPASKKPPRPAKRQLWRDACDVQQKLHALATARDSLQNRLMPSNYEEQKSAFLEALESAPDQLPPNPVFEYDRPLRDDELARRFPISDAYLKEAKEILERHRARRSDGSPRRRSSSPRKRDPAEHAKPSLTPEELVESAESYLGRCIPGDEWAEAIGKGTGPNGDEASAPSLLSRRLIVHFMRKRAKKGSKGAAWQSIAVKGCVLRVPLPFHLTKDNAEALWAHELGTHFIRNYVNEPVTREAPWRLAVPPPSVGSEGREAKAACGLVSPSMAPFGSSAGVERHVARMLWSRTCQHEALRNRTLEKLSASAPEGEAALAGVAGGSPSDIAAHGAATGPRMHGPVSPPAPPEAPEQAFARTWHAARRDNSSLADAGARNPRRVTGEEGKHMLATREAEEHACEEGLAVCNQHIHQGDAPLLVKPALMYYAAARGLSLGFSDLFAELGRYVADPSRRFAICARVKGGLCDTSKLQATCGRDQCYLAGAVELLRRRRDVDLAFLHRGRITFDEAVAPAGGMIDDTGDPAGLPEDVAARRTWHGCARFWAPPHLHDMRAYRARLDALAEANGL